MNGAAPNGGLTSTTKTESSTVHNLLVENGSLIETISGFQRIGKYDDVPKYMELLYRNIIHLAKLGDLELANQLQQETGLTGAATLQQSQPLPGQAPSANSLYAQPTQPAANGQPTPQRIPATAASNAPFLATTSAAHSSPHVTPVSTSMGMANGVAAPSLQHSLPQSTQGQQQFSIPGSATNPLPSQPSQYSLHQPPMQQLSGGALDPATAAAVYYQHHPQTPHPYTLPSHHAPPQSLTTSAVNAPNPDAPHSST